MGLKKLFSDLIITLILQAIFAGDSKLLFLLRYKTSVRSELILLYTVIYTIIQLKFLYLC
jgi:hypothetical protein